MRCSPILLHVSKDSPRGSGRTDPRLRAPTAEKKEEGQPQLLLVTGTMTGGVEWGATSAQRKRAS